jgi:hypothetical protein
MGMLAFWLGCMETNTGERPPVDRFHYPVSIAVNEPPDRKGKPFLYVVNSNFDLEYNRGSVMAVDTSVLPEPLNGPVGGAVNSNQGVVFIDSFAGMIASYTPSQDVGSRTNRLFVPTRSEGRLYAFQADGPLLSCWPAQEANSSDSQDCFGQGVRLQQANNARVRTVDPFGIAIEGQKIFVTPLRPADDPENSGKNRISYLAQSNTEDLHDLSFFDIGIPASQGIVALPEAGVFFTGKYISPSIGESKALRVLVGQEVIDLKLTEKTQVDEGRGIARSAHNGQRLFISTSDPDGLLIYDTSLEDASDRFVNLIALPSGASEVMVIARPNKKDLVAIACTDSNIVALYDDELGEVVAMLHEQMTEQGLVTIDKPFGMAQSNLPAGSSGEDDKNGRRIYVASFGNHSLSVIDISDLDNPRSAMLVGSLQ